MIKVIIEDLQFIQTESHKKDNNMMRESLKESLLKYNRPVFSWEVFKKDFRDRLAIKEAKRSWKRHMKSSVEGWTAKSDYYTKKVIL